MFKETKSLLRAVDWKFVLMSTAPLWLFIIGFVIWHKCSSNHASVVQNTSTFQPIEIEAVREYSYDPLVNNLTFLVAIPPEKPIVVSTNLPDKQMEIDPEIASIVGDQLKNLFHGLMTAKPEPVAIKPQAAKLERLLPDGFKTHGTEIAFARTLSNANKKAKSESKLVYILHLSGNIESDGFT